MPTLLGADDVQWGESWQAHPCYSWWSWQFDTLWAPLIRLWPHSSLYYLQKCCFRVCSANLLIMYHLGTLNFCNHSSWCLFKQRYSETGTCIRVNVRACSKLGVPVPMRYPCKTAGFPVCRALQIVIKSKTDIVVVTELGFGVEQV